MIKSHTCAVRIEEHTNVEIQKKETKEDSLSWCFFNIWTEFKNVNLKRELNLRRELNGHFLNLRTERLNKIYHLFLGGGGRLCHVACGIFCSSTKY